MKTTLISTLSVIIFSLTLSAQEKDIKTAGLFTNDGKNFELYGADAYDFINNLFEKHPETKRGKKYIWKFKNVSVPGIDEKVTFQVHQGIRGKIEYNPESEEFQRGSSYFSTFKNEGDKQKILSNLTESQTPAVLIYIKEGNKHGVKNKKKAAHIESYLSSFI